MNMRKNKAFTLAETLVVMGIIGVVAALTLPNLSASTGNKENVARVQKAYSTINEAFDRVQAEYGNIKRWPSRDFGWNGSDDTDFFANRISEYLKVSKNCGRNANQGCMPTSIKYMNGTAYSAGFSMLIDSNTAAYKLILADGSSFALAAASGDIYMVVDIDGPRKGSATLGKDIFDFYFSSDFSNAGIRSKVPFRVNSDEYGNLLGASDLSSNFKTGLGLATWILQTGNMDYLKATNGTCKKNNKTLDWNNTTCN